MYMKVVKDGEDCVGDVDVILNASIDTSPMKLYTEAEITSIEIAELMPKEEFFDGLDEKLAALPKSYLFVRGSSPDSKVSDILYYLSRDLKVVKALGMEFIEARMQDLAEAYRKQMAKVEAYREQKKTDEAKSED